MNPKILAATNAVLLIAAASLVDMQSLEAQRRLSELGYDVGSIDGKLGPRTKQALAKFQRDEHLSVTSTLDRQTTAKLFKDDGARRGISSSPGSVEQNLNTISPVSPRRPSVRDDTPPTTPHSDQNPNVKSPRQLNPNN